MHVFITGAAGFIGRAVTKELQDHGHTVIGLSHSEGGAQKIREAGAQAHPGSIEDLESLKSGARSADAVIHLAWILDFQNNARSCAIDRTAIQALAEALQGTGKPLIIASGSLIYPKGSLATEDTEPEQGTPLAERAKSSDLVARVSRELNVRGSVVVLPPIVHGVDDRAMLPMYAEVARRNGVVNYVGDGSARWPTVHREDAARVFRLVLEKGRSGAIYNAVAEQAVRTKDILEAVSKQLKLPLASKPQSEAAETMGFFGYLFGLDNPVSSEKTKRELGWKPTQISLLADLRANYFCANVNNHANMTHQSSDASDIVPAHLDFLAIFSPDLGQSERTEQDQIVFYWSKPTRTRGKKRRQDAEQLVKQAKEEENERMRQIGLAQGMVNFARTFGGGKDVDAIDTERHRIVVKQLERGWWILASVCLTRIPIHLTTNNPVDARDSPRYESSSREVSPSILLVQQLLRGHRIFLLHHGQTLSDLYVRLPRNKFCGILEKFWTHFAKDLDVLLHGNPIADVHTATKLSAAGELGIGVGEEDWGSGEREALEGLIRDTEGLVDLVVLRSNADRKNKLEKQKDTRGLSDWYANDLARGVVFSGSGSLAQISRTTVSEWMQHVADHPALAYGVQESPSSTRSRPQKPSSFNRSEIAGNERHQSLVNAQAPSAQDQAEALPRSPRPSIPPSVVSVIEESLDRATVSAETPNKRPGHTDQRSENDVTKAQQQTALTDWGAYLKFGYGTAWGTARAPLMTPNPPGNDAEKPSEAPKGEPLTQKQRRGHFPIGLAGGLDEIGEEDLETADADDLDGTRVSVRTLHVELNETQRNDTKHLTDEPQGQLSRSVSSDSERKPDFQRLRVVLYKDDPFLFTLLFEPTTPSLTISSYYRTLHKQLQALHKPLDACTCAQRVQERLVSTIPSRIDKAPVYDLMYESSSMTVRSSIPSIPQPVDEPDDVFKHRGPWTRLEALNVHTQALAAIADARADGKLQETSSRTQRDWWIVWMRQRLSTLNGIAETDLKLDLDIGAEAFPRREAILVRKCIDDVAPREQQEMSSNLRKLSLTGTPPTFGLGRFIGRDASGSETSAKESLESATSASKTNKVSEGIGLDPRKYVESLFNLSR